MTTVLGVGLMVFAAVPFVWGWNASGTVQSGVSDFSGQSPGAARDGCLPAAGVLGMGLLFSARSRTD